MRKGDETKREILRAAEQLFCQKGYEAASMQEIVRAAGVSKGGIYHHFASKEEIMTLLSHQHAQESAERAEAQLADAPDDLARLNLLLSACLPMRDEDTAFTAMLLPMATSPEGRAMALTYLEHCQTASTRCWNKRLHRVSRAAHCSRRFAAWRASSCTCWVTAFSIWRHSSCRRKTTSSRAICPPWWIADALSPRG